MPTSGKDSLLHMFYDAGEKNFIAIGVSDGDSSSHSPPGWEPMSIGFHTNSGVVYESNSDEGKPTNQPGKRGDTIRCSLRAVCDAMQHNRTEVLFFRNGTQVSSVLTVAPPEGFYGVIGMMSRNEKVTISPPMSCRKKSFRDVWAISTPSLISHREDGICMYTGPGTLDEHEHSIGSARAVQQVNPLGDLSQRSFTLRILNSGEKNFIGMGVVDKAYPTDLLPGWEDTSIGYHADTGDVFQSSGDGYSTNHVCKQDDVMECFVSAIDNSPKQVKVAFFKNGIQVMQVTAWTPQGGFYFCFGMMSRSEMIQVILPEISLPFEVPKLEFEDVWEVKNAHIEHRGSGICHYVGSDNVGTIRSKEPINPFGLANSYEVKIKDPGSNCYIALGVCSQQYSTDDLPGWDDLSVGFHTDDGCILQKSDAEGSAKYPCSKGDVIRCTLEPIDGTDKQMHVIFHKNGQFVGKVIFWKPGGGKVFAQIGCMSVGEVIQVASPLQKISRLNPDRAMVASVPPTPSTSAGDFPVPSTSTMYGQTSGGLPSGGLPSGGTDAGSTYGQSGGLPSGGVPPMDAGSTMYGKTSGGLPSGEGLHTLDHGFQQNPHTTASHEEMQRLWYSMYYHHYQNPHHFRGQTMPLGRGQTMPPFRGHPFGPGPFPHRGGHHRMFFHGDRTAYPGAPPLDYSMSYPPPEHLDQHEGTKRQQSEPAYGQYSHQLSSSSSASDTQSLVSSSSPSQVSSQLSTSSMETVLEDTDTTMPTMETLLEDTDTTMPTMQEESLSLQKQHLHLQLTDSPEVSQQKYSKSPEVLIKNITLGSAESITPSNVDARLLCLSGSTTGRALLQRSSSVIVEPVILSKEENKMFKTLHNTSVVDGGSLQFTPLSPDSPLNSFITFRLPLSEKLNYFQIEIVEMSGEEGSVAMGVVWDHYPVYHLPGVLEGSVAFHTKGSTLFSGKQSKPATITAAGACVVGDVIGCRAALHFKSETLTAVSGHRNHIKIEFFRNGLLLCAENVFLPPNGFYPAIGLTGLGTKVNVQQNIQLSPLSYFETHPLPPNFSNFAVPAQEQKGWQSLRNAEVNGDTLSALRQCCGHPSVIQNLSPFSSTCNYFQVQLQCDVHMYTVLSVGASPKLSSDSKNVIPGELPDSIAFLPQLGFIMSKKTISSTIPDIINSELHVRNTTVGIGMEFVDCPSSTVGESSGTGHPHKPSSVLQEESVRVFFTVNGQEVSSLFTSIPKGGLYPMLAVEWTHNMSNSIVAKMEFPKQFPCSKQFPLGFARGTQNGFIQKHDSYTIQDKGTEEDSTPAVRTLQGAQPLSPARPYFEVRVVSGGETYAISCGASSFGYPLDVHPGLQKDSIAFHVTSGSVAHNGTVEAISSPPTYDGALIGCGASFPENGLTTRAEIFFTVNHKVVCRRLVQVPQMGLFPTIGMKTKGGVICVDCTAPSPCSDVRFKSMLGLVENIKLDGSTIELASSSNPGAFQMKQPMSVHEQHYFTTKCLSDRNGRILMGFSTSLSCPLNFLKSLNFKACVIDIVSGRIMMNNEYLRTKEVCCVDDCHTFGVGIEPLDNSKQSLLFFTANNYIISYAEVEIEEEVVYPCVLMMDSTTKVKLDVCNTWPRSTPIGPGWARYSNLKLVDSKIVHSSTQMKKRLPVGFAQASFPLTGKNSYFELEICSREMAKAIAIGLAPRTHPNNQWIGWCKSSIGYHCDDGRLFKESNFGQNFGPKANAGDTIGCGARFNQLCYLDVVSGHGKVKIEVYFTLNGALLGTQKVTIPPGGLFPTICLESPSESVIFHQHSMFPPVPNLVCIKEWRNAYSVHQVGKVITNCCRRKEINGSLPKAFCQARKPFCPDKPYFEVMLSSLNPSHGCVQVGASVNIALGACSPNTHSILYSTAGCVITRKASQKYSRNTVTSDVGDRVGCAVLSTSEFVVYVNDAKVFSTTLEGVMKEQDLYPTIILTHPSDAVIPSLELELPVWNHSSLIGWLRSERVRLSGNIVKYVPESRLNAAVGVAQIRQPLKLGELPYYEVEIIDAGEKGSISVGLAPADYPLNKHPGWYKNSVAYHGDDGRLFQESGAGVPLAWGWKRHDIIGLGIRSLSGKCSVGDFVQVYFTRNGVDIGHTTVCIPASGFFPTIGFHSAGEKVRVFLGEASTTPYNHDSLKLCWRALVGIRLRLEKPSGNQILSYCDNGRMFKNPGVTLSVGLYAEALSDTMQYFEVKLLSVGPVGIGIGVAPANYPLDQAPGWTTSSVAYHTDNGKLYNATGNGKDFGPIAHCGDVIGCGVSFTPSNSKHCFVFFTYNGVEIGRVRSSLPATGLYPAFALTSERDKISISFLETFKPKLSESELNFVGLMRISNCSYFEQIVKFKGSRSSGCNFSPAVAQFGVPLSSHRNYFTANVVECGDSILIGLATKDYPIRYAPGTTSVSVAYNITKGCIKAVFDSENFFSVDGPVCLCGDSVGCGIEFNSDSKTERPYIFFTHNNVLVQKVDMTIELFDDLYPVICFVPQNKSSSIFMDWNSMNFIQSNQF